jgi:3-hydroxyacyl-[acyl-carrier-protein] dehydratase
MGRMNIEEIKGYIPHKYPFIMIDRVIDIVPGKTITAIKNVTIDEPFFTGHFPRMSIMPGVLLIEAMAQASGILIYKSLEILPGSELYFLAGINNVRFKRLVIPGDQLRLHVELVKHRLDLWKFTGTATVDNEIACTAEFMNIKEQQSD